MAVGINIDKTVLDTRAGQTVLQLRSIMDQVVLIKNWLDTKTDAELQAPPFNYTAGEVALLKSAYTDLNNLVKVARGQGTQAQANDFFFWASKLTGLQ